MWFFYHTEIYSGCKRIRTSLDKNLNCHSYLNFNFGVIFSGSGINPSDAMIVLRGSGSSCRQSKPRLLQEMEK